MQPFAFLTSQGRARRLRKLALEALQQYDVEVARLRLVNNETNCTFRVDTIDGSTFALRVSVPEVHSKDEIEAEVAWQLAIARETDIPVALPLPSRSGDYVITAEAQGVPEERQCVLFGWLRGRPLEEVASPAGFHAFGALAARLHTHGAQYVRDAGTPLRILNALYPVEIPEMILDETTTGLFPPEGYALLLEMHAAVRRELEWLYSGKREAQLVHGDLQWWNVMAYRGHLQVIDFEDLRWAFPVQDIAITFHYTACSDNYQRLRDAFQAGYESVAPWPEMYPGQVELHMVHRALDLFNYVLASTLRYDRDLLESSVESFQTHHRETFNRWRSQFDERTYL